MHPFFLFLLKGIAISCLFFVYYLLVLKDRRLHSFNRCYLLMSICASLFIPFVRISWLNARSHVSKMVDVLSVIRSGGEEELGVDSVNHGFHVAPVTISIILFFTVSLVLLVILARQIVLVYRLKSRYPVTIVEGISFVLTDLPEAPFSFMNNLFWRKDIVPEMAAQIQRHELTHIRQKHSYDKLFSQVVAAIFWVNPFFKLIGKELEIVHEYIADQATVAESDTQSLARLLLYNRSHIQLQAAHSFFHSPIKRRLNMLKKPTKVTFAQARMLLVLPLLTGTIFLFSFSGRNQPIMPAKKTVLVIDAGHGGKDDGAVYNGFVEKEMNLRIAKKIASLAQKQGIEVHMTREDDLYPTLQERVSISNSFHPDAFISVHVNDSKFRSVNDVNNDYEIIVTRHANSRIDESKKLGGAISKQLASIGIRVPALTAKGLHVLNVNEAPAILIECGDIRNPQETDLIQSDEQLESFCTAILNGVAVWRGQ